MFSSVLVLSIPSPWLSCIFKPRSGQDGSVGQSHGKTDAELGDDFDRVLEPGSIRELQSALKADASGVADALEVVDNPPDQPEAGPKQEPASSSGCKPRKRNAATDASGRTSLSRLGIQSITRCKKRGMVCFFCHTSVDKGELRFEYIHRLNAPPRSIHTTCLTPIPSEAQTNSVDRLKELLQSNAPQDAESRSACQTALEALDAPMAT